MFKEINNKIKLITNDKNWVESEAIEQLKLVSELEGVQQAIGLPDIHSGPVGVTIATQKIIYPHLIGNDVGCGMALFQTDLKKSKIKRDKWVRKLSGLEDSYDGNINAIIEEAGVESTAYDSSIGTIGGGNHFAELQSIEKAFDENALLDLGVDSKNLVLLVHSGSRSLGSAIFQEFAETNTSTGLKIESEEATKYLQQHDNAVHWAKLSRKLIAERFLEQLGSFSKTVLDVEHNCIAKTTVGHQEYYLHRKGAARSDLGAVVIAGSRGTYSYLVLPIGGQEQNLFSLAHGSGRKWKRKNAKSILGDKYTIDKMQLTEIGSAVICEDKNLLYEEAPQAYKNIEHIIAALADAGIIKVLAQLKPIITYKTRK